MRKSLHDMQVEEFMNQNKELSALVSEMNRQGVNRFEPPMEAEKMLDVTKMELQSVDEHINKFLIGITDKLHAFETIKNDAPEISRTYDALFHKTINYISDLVDFNRIMTVYVDPNLPFNIKNNFIFNLYVL